MRVLIVGVPNAGKSTLINTLVGRKAAKTGDEAGITRREDRIVLADDFYLYDTPGMLWPRIAVPQSGQNLAAAGSIGRNAYDDETVALDLLAYLKRAYPDRLTERYGVAPGGMSECEDEVLLTAIGRRLGALAGGGRVDTQVAAERVRSGPTPMLDLGAHPCTPSEFAAQLRGLAKVFFPSNSWRSLTASKAAFVI